MLSIIIPANNEQAVIARCLRTMTLGSLPGELQIIVACNGCTDRTAQIAANFPGPITVLQVPQASKVAALNAADDAAIAFPRFYVDADVRLSIDAIRATANLLNQGHVLAASPVLKIDLSNSSWPVQAYYKIWTDLPYTKEGMIGTGVYALSKKGRESFTRFPDLIADDGYIRALFTPRQRAAVTGSISIVTAPSTLSDLIKIMTRGRLGNYQLAAMFPDLVAQEKKTKPYGQAARQLLFRPWRWPHAIIYVWVNLVSRLRAKKQLQHLSQYVWERDQSTRNHKTQ